MPVSTQPHDYCYSRTMDGNCYTALQPVPLDLGSLITTSICLQEDSCGAYHTSVHYVASSCDDYYTDEPDISRSPESVYEEDLSDISEVLQRRMIGCKRDDDDDNESVVFEFGDLDFLDFGDRGETCSRQHQSVIVTPGGRPVRTYSSSPAAYCCSPLSLSQTTTSPLLAQTAVTPASSTSSPCSSSSTPPSPSSLTTSSSSPYHLRGYQQQRGVQEPSPLWPLYYEDPVYALPPYCQDSAAAAAAAVRFPPTPSPSPSPRLQEGAGGLHCHPQHHHHHHHQQPLQPPPSLSPISCRMDDDEEEDAEYKPYCDSRRGAKKNLLWKFLLWVLDNHTDLAQWTDVRRGIFKFVDTARVSNMWGQRKHKKDMTFEKLSRGIRHYYKRGLMERMSNTRLVYKFNWEKVPRRYRKF